MTFILKFICFKISENINLRSYTNLIFLAETVAAFPEGQLCRFYLEVSLF